MSNHPPYFRNEGDYLAHEAEIAQAAIKQLISEMGNTAKLAADPRPWAERYPLPAVGTALVGGFATAAVVKPAVFGQKESSATHRVRGRERRKRTPSWMRPIFNLLKGSLKNAIIAGITAKTTAEATTDAAVEEKLQDSGRRPVDQAATQQAQARTSAQL